MLRSHVRVGLLGCGAVGRLHAQRLRADDRVQLAFLADAHSQAATTLRDECAPRAAVGDGDCAALIERHPVDAIVICSPTRLHFEQASAALERGVDVLCEKPLTPERATIVELASRSRELGRVFSVSYQRRYMAAYRTARRELSENTAWYGALSEIHVFVCERWRQTIQGTWRDDPALGAGYFGDAGSHQIDIVHFVTGQSARRVLAFSDRRENRVEIVTRAIAEFDDGVMLVAHFVGDAHHWREEITFHCRDADLLLRSEKFFDPHLFRAKNNVLEPISDLMPDSNPDRAFIDAVLSRTPTASPPECALATHNWTEGVLRSARIGGWIDL